MKNRKFEAWFAKHNGLDREYVEQMFDGDTYRSRGYYVEIAWAAWCAALGFELHTEE